MADVGLHGGDMNAVVSKDVRDGSGLDRIANCGASSVALKVCRFGEILRTGLHVSLVCLVRAAERESCLGRVIGHLP